MPIRLAILTLLTIPIAAGCDQQSGPGVQGAVTYNGAPVEEGYITFSTTGSGNSFGAKIVDGKYVAEKAHAGTFIVFVHSDGAADAPPSREAAQRQAASGPPPDAIPENAQGNGQTVEITGDDQTLDFVLTSPAS